MRKTPLTLLACLFLVGMLGGCGDKSSVEVEDAVDGPQGASTAKGPVQILLDSIDAYNGQDLAALIALFSPSIEWKLQTAMKNVIKGRGDAARHLMQERKTFPDCKIGLYRVLEHGDTLVAHGVFHATHQGPIHGIEPTGKKVGYDFYYFVTIKDNKIKYNVAYFNPAIPLRQIGAIQVKDTSVAEFPDKLEVVRDKPNPENQAKVKQFYALLQAGSFDKLNEYLGQEFELNNRALLQSYTGIDGSKPYFEKEYADFKGLKIEVDEMYSAGPYVAVRLVKRGSVTMKAEGSDESKSKDVEIDEAHFIKLIDGKITELNIVYDELQLFHQIEYSVPGTLAFLSDKQPAADVGGSPDSAAKDKSLKTAEPVKTPGPKNEATVKGKAAVKGE